MVETSGPNVAAVVVAAGSGSRFGGPKVYEPFPGGPRVLDVSLRAARAACRQVVLVTSESRAAEPEPGADVVVAGGATRAESVRAGLAAADPAADVIVVHDGARPLASPAVWDAVIAAVVDGADGAIPAIPVADTLKRRDGDVVSATVDRADLVGVQTPQAFRAESLRAAHQSGDDATDDAGLVEAAGGRVVLVAGEERNRKITTRADLDLLVAAAGGATLPRIGLGFDSHGRAESGEGRVLVLGGVQFPEEVPLAGHSDADVVAHAVIDALLGATGEADIGQWFPDDDPAHSDADSIEMLRRVVADLAATGWAVGNVDCTVIAETPKLAPYRSEMEQRLCDAIGASVSVKATRPEALPGLASAGTIICMATALVVAR